MDIKIGDTVRIIRYGRAPRETLRKNGTVLDLFTHEGEKFALVQIHETGEEYSYNIQKLKIVGESNSKFVDTEVGTFVNLDSMSKLGLKRETKLRFIL